jgi:hypothetical protein
MTRAGVTITGVKFMQKNPYDKNEMTERVYVKINAWSRNKIMKFALPIIAGIIIGLFTTLIMKLMGRHISF